MAMSGDNTTSYLRKSAGGGGKSSVVMGGAGSAGNKGFVFSPPKMGDRAVGTKRFDVTNRSLNRGRGM